jgi:two-component system sensor histidine kinase UhpB
MGSRPQLSARWTKVVEGGRHGRNTLATPYEPPPAAATVVAMVRWMASLPVLWRVFAAYAAVLALATVALVALPVTVSVPPSPGEVLVLLVGLAVALALTLALLRPALRPLTTLTSTMYSIDPLEPGRRVPVVGAPDVAALARAFNNMLERLESERRESARQALTVQENERARVARELHDEVGQIFTAIMLQIESLAGKASPDLMDELDELRETARTGAVDVRRIAARLRPEALEDLGLQSALSALTNAFGEQTGIRMERELEPVQALDRDQELVVYRVAQEALTNVARHAGARRVEVSLRRDDGAAVLRVSDDGRGLPDDAMASSNGIRGMRERAMLIGARLELSSNGAGTDVVLRVPGNAP